MTPLLLSTLDLVGTFAFAISGATLGVRKRLDLFGVLTLAFAAATAGGITRDLIIGAHPPAAFGDWRYLATAMAAGLVTFFGYEQVERVRNPVQMFDAVGLALFAVSGTSKALAFGIEVCREIGNSAAMKDFVKREVAPGKALTGKAMDDFVRNGATTYFHQAGTCRMGKDAQAVVDAKLRVNGVQGLRIADSSIMPRIAGVATMATCALIGERMADILTQGA